MRHRRLGSAGRREPHSFGFLRSPLEKVGCERHFGESRREVGKLLGHTKLDIVLSSNTHQSLSEMMDLLAGLRVIQMLLVEESCW